MSTNPVFRITDPNNFYCGRLCVIRATEKFGDCVIHTAALLDWTSTGELTFAIKPQYLEEVELEDE